MADGYLKKRLKELGRSDIAVSSAGTLFLPGMPATEDAIEIAAEDGTDLSGHRSRVVTEEDMKRSDLIFVMERFHKKDILDMVPGAAEKVYLLNAFQQIGDHSEPEGSGIPDPIGKPKEFYRETFKAIKSAIERVIEAIT